VPGRSIPEMAIAIASNLCVRVLTTLVAVLLSVRKVLVLNDHREPIYKSLSLDLKSLPLDHKVLENCRGLRILQTVRYREVNKFSYRHRVWGYGEEWLTCWYQILLTDIYQSVSESFFTVTQCCCPRGSVSLSLDFKSLTRSLIDEVASTHVARLRRLGAAKMLRGTVGRPTGKRTELTTAITGGATIFGMRCKQVLWVEQAEIFCLYTHSSNGEKQKLLVLLGYCSNCQSHRGC